MLLHVSVTVHRQTDASELSFPFVFPRHSHLTSARRGPPTLHQLSKETHTMFVRISSFHLQRHHAQNVQTSGCFLLQGKHQSTGGTIRGCRQRGTTVTLTGERFSGPQIEGPEERSGFAQETNSESSSGGENGPQQPFHHLLFSPH